MPPVFTFSLFAFFAALACVGALPLDTFKPIATLSLRQVSNDCNATCNAFQTLADQCSASHCGCTVDFLQAQGGCLLCQTETPEDAAAVQFLLDSEMDQCHSEGIKIEYQLPLPPAAAALVEEFNVQSEQLRQEQTAFLALQIAGGHVGLVALLLFGVFSRRIHRDSMFFNFCITWIFSSIVFSLLLYRGTQGNTIANSLGEAHPVQCLAQAALISGAQVMTAFSTLALIIQLWFGLRANIFGDPKQARWMTIALLATPYLLFLAFTLMAIFIGRQLISLEDTTSPSQSVFPNNFYCFVVEHDGFLLAVYGVTLGLLIVTVIFDGLIIRILYRHWWAFRHVKPKNSVTLSTLLRVMVFSIYRIAVAAADGTILRTPPVLTSDGSGDALVLEFGVPVWVDMLQATIPLVAFLILGADNDTINALLFWRKKPREPEKK